jgi:hypothetical protein
MISAEMSVISANIPQKEEMSLSAEEIFREMIFNQLNCNVNGVIIFNIQSMAYVMQSANG